MTTLRKRIVLAGLALFALSCIYLPWRHPNISIEEAQRIAVATTFPRPDKEEFDRVVRDSSWHMNARSGTIEYALAGHAPMRATIAIDLLAIEWIGITFVIMLAAVCFRDSVPGSV